MKSINNRMPKEKNMLAVSLIKEILNKVSEDFTKETFFYTDSRSNKKMKDINTSIYISNFVDSEEDLIVKGDIILNISFYNESMYYYLYNGALKLKSFNFKGYEFEINSISINKEKVIKNNEVLFKTMSPIVIKNKNGIYLDCNSKEYIDSLNYIADLTLKTIRGYGLQEKLEFMPLNFKKKVLKEKIRDFKEREYYYINAHTGTFSLKGNIEDLNALYKTGIGYRRTQNSGMVEVLR